MVADNVDIQSTTSNTRNAGVEPRNSMALMVIAHRSLLIDSSVGMQASVTTRDLGSQCEPGMRRCSPCC